MIPAFSTVKVIALSRPPIESPRIPQDLLDCSRFSFIAADPAVDRLGLSMELYQQLCDTVDIVIHGAASTSLKMTRATALGTNVSFASEGEAIFVRLLIGAGTGKDGIQSPIFLPCGEEGQGARSYLHSL